MRDIRKYIELTDSNLTTGSVIKINNEADLENLYFLITNPKRKLPVIVISECLYTDAAVSKYFEIDDGYLVDGKRLALDLIFIAHVIYLPLEFQTPWTTKIGELWSVFNGAVRTYYPNADLEDTAYYNHPYLVATKIMSMNYISDNNKEYFGGHAFRHKLSHTIKTNNMYERINWPELGYKFFYQASKEEKFAHAKLSENNSEWCQLLEEDNKQLEKQVKELNILISIQEEDIKVALEAKKKYSAINVTNQLSIGMLEQELDTLRQQPKPITYPTSYEDIPTWIQDNFLGLIELLPRAIKSLKSAVYRDINFVCRVINLLGTTYYNMRIGIVDKADYDSELISLGVEDMPAISDISAGEQGDEYFPFYNGHRCKLERHITKGVSRDARECLRIYFFWDYENSQVVIGSLPGHLSIRSSN